MNDRSFGDNNFPPYVEGTQENEVFQMVVNYNVFQREIERNRVKFTNFHETFIRYGGTWNRTNIFPVYRLIKFCFGIDALYEKRRGENQISPTSFSFSSFTTSAANYIKPPEEDRQFIQRSIDKRLNHIYLALNLLLDLSNNKLISVSKDELDHCLKEYQPS